MIGNGIGTIHIAPTGIQLPIIIKLTFTFTNNLVNMKLCITSFISHPGLKSQRSTIVWGFITYYLSNHGKIENKGP